MSEFFKPTGRTPGETPEGIILKAEKPPEEELDILQKRVVDFIFKEGLEKLMVIFLFNDYPNGTRQHEISFEDFKSQLLSEKLQYDGKQGSRYSSYEGKRGIIGDLSEIITKAVQKYLDTKLAKTKGKMETLMLRLDLDPDDLSEKIAELFKERVATEIIEDLRRFGNIGDGGLDTEEGEKAFADKNFDWFLDEKNYPEDLVLVINFLRRLGLNDAKKRHLAEMALALSKNRSD